MSTQIEVLRNGETEPKRAPRHIVVIPDGNGRWAQKHNLPIAEGHLRGAQRMVSFVDKIDTLDTEVCTFWGFSTENWTRSPKEVGDILEITRRMLESKIEEFVAKNRRFRHVGRKDRLPGELLSAMSKLEEITANNSGKTFVLALDYGGRNEIVRAVNKAQGTQVDEEEFENFLDTSGLPKPDLIIRTSGEMRTSGIYPYQAAYAEFISSPVLFPDFDEKELDLCLSEYSNRKRRFGARVETDVKKPYEWLGLEDVSFDGYTKAVLPHINNSANLFIEKWRKDIFYKTRALQEDIDIYQSLLSGGKKVRAGLVVVGYENFGGEPEFREGALSAAVGYELIHNSFLIHDDIEDNSPLRRGKPSVHEEYAMRYRKSGGVLDDQLYGRALALNTGSIGPLKAQDILWEIRNKESRIIQANKWVRKVIETTLLGQRRDLTETTLDQLTTRQVFEIYHQKTAVYTVVGPLVLGAILAGASRQEVGNINSFGVNLGIAFQIIDDHLGLYGTEDKLGKPVGSDLAEAKKTLHFVEAWKRADEDQRKFLSSVWGNQNVGDNDVAAVRKLVDELGVRDNSLQVARSLAEKARKVIPRISTSNITAKILEDLIDFVVDRQF